MWKLFHKLFGWDYVLTCFCHSWKVRRVKWFHNDAFCRPCMDRVLINTPEYCEGLTTWKPLTPRMFKYKEYLSLQDNTTKDNRILTR